MVMVVAMAVATEEEAMAVVATVEEMVEETVGVVKVEVAMVVAMVEVVMEGAVTAAAMVAVVMVVAEMAEVMVVVVMAVETVVCLRLRQHSSARPAFRMPHDSCRSGRCYQVLRCVARRLDLARTPPTPTPADRPDHNPCSVLPSAPSVCRAVLRTAGNAQMPRAMWH